MNSTTMMINTLQPIEFIMPNSILSLTEWHTKNVYDNENITFSMEHLYLLINWFLKQLFRNGLPDSIVSEDFVNRPIEVIEENKLEIIDHFGWAIILTISLLLLAIFVPIIWLMCWCFCCTQPTSLNHSNKRSRISNYNQIAGNENLLRHVGGHSSSSSSSTTTTRTRNNDQKRTNNYKMEGSCDCCIRPIFCIILLFLLVFSLLFIICSFVTNDIVHDGIGNLPKAANNSLADFELYLNNTQYELDMLFKTNFAQLETKVEKNLDLSGQIVTNELAIISKASSIDNLTEIVTNLQPILHDLKKLINHTNELKFLTVQLRGKIARIKQDIEDFFKLCHHEICDELKEKYQQIRQSFTISSRIENLPSLSPIIEKIQYLLDQNIIEEIRKGKEKLDLISKDIQRKVDNILPQIRSNISQANRILVENVDNINTLLSQPIPHIRLMQKYLTKSEDFVKRNNFYIHNVGLFTVVILMVILVCYFLGLLSNICNDQPTRFNYRNRSKRGDFFTYIGMTLFFLCFTLLLSLSTISFIIGGLHDRSLCFYLKNVSDEQSNKILHLMQSELENELFSLENIEHQESSLEMKQMFEYLKKTDMIELINRCHQNQSLFNVLKLSINQSIQDVNLSEIIIFKEKNTEIHKYLNSLFNRMNINPTNIVLISDNGKELLQILKETSLETLNFSAFANSIRNSLTSIDFELLAKKLENESYRLPDNEIENIARLRNIVLDMRSAKELIYIITQKIENLTKNAERIERKSQFNGKTLRETLTILLQQANEAQQFINRKGRSEIRNVLRNYIDDLSRLLIQYSDHVEQRVINEIGRCEPVSRAYNHTVASLCDNVVLPFTACWFSVSITLLAFIPSTFLVCILNSLFKRIKRSSTRRESILIIDHYDDDDLPLAEIDKHDRNRHSHHNSTINHRRTVMPSAPHLSAFGEREHSEEEISWSPGAIPQHLYSRPPPYNF